MSRLVLETSALIAILFGEPTAPDLLLEIQDAKHCVCPATCAVEAMVVLVRKGRTTAEFARQEVLVILQSMEIAIVPFDEVAMQHALDGYLKYGKGTGSTPSVLNFGDCLSYGAAKAASGRLLYTGDDFEFTDLA